MILSHILSQINFDKASNCLHCITPSSERSVNDLRCSSFKSLRTEKPNSTVAVLGNVVIP